MKNKYKADPWNGSYSDNLVDSKSGLPEKNTPLLLDAGKLASLKETLTHMNDLGDHNSIHNVDPEFFGSMNSLIEADTRSREISALIGQLYSYCVGRINGEGKNAHSFASSEVQGFTIQVVLVPHGKLENIHSTTRLEILKFKEQLEHIDASLFNSLKKSPIKPAFDHTAKSILSSYIHQTFKITLNSNLVHYGSPQAGSKHAIFINARPTQNYQSPFVPNEKEGPDGFYKG